MEQNNKHRILVTGANGQLGTCIKELKNRFLFKHEYIFKNKSELDISNKEELYAELNRINPEIIINCAAYTNVEKAELDGKDAAFKINAEACKYLANWCKENNALLIHISTDYVFDGKLGNIYKENDPRIAQNIYGKTKSYGEDEIIKSKCNYIIIRTSWLYSRHKQNFFKKMFKLILDAKVNEIYAPIDEISIPTNATNLSSAIINICDEYMESNNKEQLHGVFHFTDDGIASRYDFLNAIYEYTNSEFKGETTIKPCHANKFPSNVIRPAFSAMDNTKIKETFKSVTTCNWRDSVKNEIEILLREMSY